MFRSRSWRCQHSRCHEVSLELQRAAEGCSTGTPIVTVTTFDGNGKLVEWLGIGEWGDRRST